MIDLIYTVNLYLYYGFELRWVFARLESIYMVVVGAMVLLLVQLNRLSFDFRVVWMVCFTMRYCIEMRTPPLPWF